MEKKLFRFTVAEHAVIYRDILIRADSAETALSEYTNNFDADFEVENEDTEYAELVDGNIELVGEILEVEEDPES